MYCFFFFNDTATTEIYTLSLHDALPISGALQAEAEGDAGLDVAPRSRSRHHDLQPARQTLSRRSERSEEHTSELQSRQYLVCRLLLEKKKTTQHSINESSGELWICD